MAETTNPYQVMPPLSETEYAALKEDIRVNGVQVPVIKDTQGNTIDGHHRERAWKELKALGFDLPDLPTEVRSDLISDQDKKDLAVSLNLQRRHLNRAQRKEVLAAMLKSTPERSDRWIADIAGCDHKTVASVRRHLEIRGEIPHLDRLHGKDGKSYVRMAYGRYKDEDRRRDQERNAEAHKNVRHALLEKPHLTDEAIADEFDVTPDFVADQRDDLVENGPRTGDYMEVRSSWNMTAEEMREDQRKRREETKRLKDEGKLKEDDARRAVETLKGIHDVLKLGHKNPNRTITPQDAAAAYVRYWRISEDTGYIRSAATEIYEQANLQKMARLLEWMEEFVPAFAREVDRALEIAERAEKAREEARKELED